VSDGDHRWFQRNATEKIPVTIDDDDDDDDIYLIFVSQAVQKEKREARTR
jgi:hypothetical protein